MKVLQVHTHYRTPSGENAAVEAETALLRSAGHEVIQHEAENPTGALRAAGAVVQAPWNRAAGRRAASAAARAGADVAHVHNTWFAMSPAVVRSLRRAGAPVVVTLHNYRLTCVNAGLFRDGHPCLDCVGTHPWHGVIHKCYKDSALASAAVAATIAVNRATGVWQRDVDLFLCLTAFARDLFVAAGLPPERLRVKPNFTADPGPRDCEPAESSNLLYVGRLAAEKGVNRLLEAWTAHRPERLELIIVGSGPERRRLERSVGPGDGVRFTGAVAPAEVRRLMLSARALLFPSQWPEPFGLTVVEAMAAGLPVLASDVGGIRDLLGTDRDSWLVPAWSTTDWIDGVQRTLDDEEVNATGLANRARYERLFNPQAGLHALESAYELAIASRQRD